jgi:hypothetical protein
MFKGFGSKTFSKQKAYRKLLERENIWSTSKMLINNKKNEASSNPHPFKGNLYKSLSSQPLQADIKE